MTREIKFRAWDGITMTSAIRLEFAHGLRLVSTSNLDFGMIGDDKCILMQFTGFKDKNGTEICEGDIYIHYKRYNEVVFKKGSFVSIDHTDEFERQSEFYLNKSDEYEVIGNIYQNSELLEPDAYKKARRNYRAISA